MAAPTPGTRTTPTGTMLRNGYQTKISFAANADVNLWERQVTPPGLDGGDKIDTTTMFNSEAKTSSPQALYEMLDSGMVCGYDESVLPDIIDLLNVETTITIEMPDGGTWAFYGALRSATPNANSNGSLPEMTCVIICTNTDPSDGSEAAPVYTAPSP